MIPRRKSSFEPSESLVVGAGISGLWAALLLARAGRRVRVIDKSTTRSAAETAELFRGVPCDVASHRLSPSALDHPLFREIHQGAPFAYRPHHGVLLFGDRRMPFPPEPLGMVRAFGTVAGLSIGAGLIARTARRHALRALRRPLGARSGEADPGFEGFMIDRVGERAYHAFYRPYAEKVWGIPPAELSQSVARRRLRAALPRASSQSLADRAVDWIEGGLRGPEQSGGFVFPTGGAAAILDWLEARLGELGVSIERGRPFRPEDAQGTPTLFAGALSELVDTTLEHRGQYLVWLAFPLDRPDTGHTYHSSDPRHWFGRVSELSAASPGQRAPGETLLCVEIPEGRWGQCADFTHGSRLEALVEQLSTAGIVPRGIKAIDAQQRFIPEVYPLYRQGWRGEWRRAMQRVAELRSVIPIGPEALFLQGGLDRCAQLAEAGVSHVEARLSVETWIAQAECG